MLILKHLYTVATVAACHWCKVGCGAPIASVAAGGPEGLQQLAAEDSGSITTSASITSHSSSCITACTANLQPLTRSMSVPQAALMSIYS